MSHTRKCLKINRPLEEFKGSALMIGCGEAKQHHFQLMGKAVGGELLHPSETFYHVSLPTDYSDEGIHDLEGNYLDAKTIKYLSKKQYNLICFEAVTEIFSSTKNGIKAINYTKKLLSEYGLCFIFFGGRSKKSMNTSIVHFDYSYSFTYGFNDSWSLMGSNKPFDLLTVLNENSYLNYMGYHVIKNKTNLNVSYNYYEIGLNKHIKSIDQKDNENIIYLNPFIKNNGFWLKYKKINTSLQEEVESDTEDQINLSK